MQKILAVDDEVAILEIYKEIFKKAGYEIQTAEDAVAALTLYQSFKPDLIVLDVQMPAGGGQKVFERLRSIVLTATPIVFVTGQPETVAHLARNMNVLILKKPIPPEALLLAVKKLLNKD